MQRYEDAQWEHALWSDPGYVKYIQTLEAMTEAMEGPVDSTCWCCLINLMLASGMYRSSMNAVGGETHDHFLDHLRPSFIQLREAIALYIDGLAHKIMHKQRTWNAQIDPQLNNPNPPIWQSVSALLGGAIGGRRHCAKRLHPGHRVPANKGRTMKTSLKRTTISLPRWNACWRTMSESGGSTSGKALSG